jgi:hypothetical protein
MKDAVGYPLNCGVLSSEPSYIFKKPLLGDDLFVLNAIPITRTISSGGSSTATQDDLLITTFTGASTITDYQTSVQQLTTTFVDTTISSSNSGVILSPDEFGIASGISTGNATLKAEANGKFSTVNVSVVEQSPISNTEFSGYATNSLAKEVSDAVDNRITSTGIDIYSTQEPNNGTNGTYVRNVNCWVNDVDLTCISPWNNTYAATNHTTGTLISPRHIIMAAHFQVRRNAQIRFVDNNNNVVVKTVVDKITHPEYSPYYPDITIAVLDSDVPNSISFAKILPSNWSNYLPSLSSQYTLPCLGLDQEEKALVTELKELDTSAVFSKPLDANRLNFYEDIIRYDSSNPAFLIINGELVIITVWTFGGAGQGTSIVYHKDAINSMMSDLGGGYSLTEVDLSGFTDFS